ncbi:MAG: hypothetical protein ACR2PQ_11460 [Myxococcota bacterium]
MRPNQHPGWGRAALAATLLLFAALPVGAVEFTDGSLSVDLETDGGFNSIFLAGLEIDGTPDVQRILGGTCFFFANPSVVSINGLTATYTAECGANFGVEVTSRLLGPIPGATDLTGVLEQTFVFTNTSGASATLDVLSEVDPALDSTIDDLAAFDETTGVITMIDEFQPILMAMSSSTLEKATFGWDVAAAGTQSFLFPTMNRSGPIGPDDVTVVLGYDFGAVPDQDTRTVTFTYEFRVAPPLPDSYLCYKTRVKSKNEFSLADRFDSGTYQSKKFSSFCTPVDIDGKGVADASSYLSGFKLKGPHAKRSQVSLESRFGPFTYDTSKTDSLLAPTSLSALERGGSSGGDVYYRCVKAKTSKGTPKLPKGVSTSLDDVVGFRTGGVSKATKICVPTTFGGGAAPTSAAYLVCHKVKPSPKNKKLFADVANVFGSGFITVKKEAELCVPATEGGG